MIENTGKSIIFYAQYIAAKVGKTSLTVTVDVWQIERDGTATEIVTAGSATEIGDGVYRYLLADSSVDEPGEYVGIFKTADSSVDQQHIPAIWFVERGGTEKLDAAVSTRLASGSYTAPDNVGIGAIGLAVAGLNDLDATDVQNAAAAALTAYDPPTKAELDSAVSDLSTFDHTTDDVTLAAGELSGLSTFNPASDTVANVTTVGTVTNPVTAGTVSDKTGYSLTSAYDPAKTAAPDATAIEAAASAALVAYDAATATDVTSAISGLSIPTATQIADGVLSRGVAHVEDVAEEGSLAEMLLGAFESATVGTTWIIRKTGGDTFNTRTLTTDANAEPVTGVTDA